MVVARLPRAAIGASARLGNAVPAEVRRVDGGHAWLFAHGSLEGVAHGEAVALDDAMRKLPLGACALGRAIDASGRALDGKAALRGRLVRSEPEAPSTRVAVRAPLWCGIRCIDALMPIGIGARVGLFGAAGTGKSTLLEAFASAAAADAVVVALIGERGREAQQWIERCDRRTTVVCATSDRPAAERVRAARVAFAHAAALRERGVHVLLVLDSLARTAMALRELGLAAGEPVGRAGYPPSVFAELARLVEVAGATPHGSMTLVATVLDDGDERDPVSDAARSLLDGHIQLSGALLRAGRFPAIDVGASASRTMHLVASPEHVRSAGVVRDAIAQLARTEDARMLGIATNGARIEAAVRLEEEIEAFLRQDARCCDAAESLDRLYGVAAKLGSPAPEHTTVTFR